MKNVLIIGGWGFIGTQLTKAHLEKGDYVSVLDNESNNLPIQNGLISHKNFGSYYHQNVEAINCSLTIENFDLVYHLASESRPLEFNKKYKKIIDANVIGLQEVLKYLRPDTRLVYASTSEIYGDSENIKLSEKDVAYIQPEYSRNIYALSKLLAESILQNRTDKNWIITRLFNSYGPKNRIDDTKVIPMIINSIRNKEPFPLCGSGVQIRSFTYIDDTVRGLMKAGETIESHEIYNIGSPYYHSIKELIELVQSMVEMDYIQKEYRLGEPVIRRADIEKSLHRLNFRAEIPLKQGLEKIFKYHNFLS